jgi:hypothetical protein
MDELLSTGKDIFNLEKLQKEYSEGLFRRIPLSEKQTLLHTEDGSTIGISSLRDNDLTKGCRIPAKDIKTNKQLKKLEDLTEPPSEATSSKPNKRGVSNVSFFTVWSAYRKGRTPAYSDDYKQQWEQGDRLVKMTRPLWQELTRRMRVLCPGQYNELDRPELPEGTKRLAGVWAGFGGKPHSHTPHRNSWNRKVYLW